MKLDPKKIESQTLKRMLNLNKADVLEVGCGAGRLSSVFKTKNNRLLAIDPDPRRLRQARKKVKGVVFKQGTINTLKTGRNFDYIIFSMSFHHLPSRSRASALKIARLRLKSGGQIILIEPEPNTVITDLVTIFQPIEKKRIQEAFALLAQFSRFQLKTSKISLSWNFDDFRDFYSNFLTMINQRITLGKIRKLKIALQVQAETKPINLIDKVNIFQLEGR